MKDRGTDSPRVYRRVEHWPPCTYRDYPDVTPETLISFINFLGTENTSREIKLAKLGDVWRINIAWEFANA